MVSTGACRQLTKTYTKDCTAIALFRAQEMCESRGGRSGLPVANSPYGLCGRTATLEEEGTQITRAQGPCENRGGRPGLPVPNSPYDLCGRKATLNEKHYFVQLHGLRPSLLPVLARRVGTGTCREFSGRQTSVFFVGNPLWGFSLVRYQV